MLVFFVQLVLLPFYCKNSNDIQLSKSLSYILRHGALKEGVTISEEGYVAICDILQQKSIQGRYSQEDIERVVSNNDKQRFKIRVNPHTGVKDIKANQGHSIQIAHTDLTPILEPKYNVVVHGTYLKCWESIRTNGLHRMKRQHIHLAKGTLDDVTVISGPRRNIDIYIFINIAKALGDGLKFYESSNGVILTPGDEKGYLKSKYFAKVTKVSTGRLSYC